MIRLAEQPARVAFMESAVLTAIAWIHRRVSSLFEQAPWSLVAIGDERVEPEVKQKLASSFRSQRRCLCCTRPGWGRKLMKSSMDLTSVGFAVACRAIAENTSASIADVERRHAGNLRRNRRDT